MRRRLAAASTLALLGTGMVVAATPAAATARHVGVVVRYATGRVAAGCATPGGTGLQVLEQHHSVVLGAQQYSGFVLKIDGTGTTRPDNTHYWSYWHSAGGGAWTYSSSGAASSHPHAGTVEGWSYVNGQAKAPRPPRYTYAALCGHLDPKPRPAAKPTPRTTPAAATPTPTPAPAHTAMHTAVHTPTHSTARSTAYAPPAASGRASAVRHRVAGSPTRHARASRTPSSQPSPSSQPASRTPATHPRYSSTASVVAADPGATTNSDSGFPAWGTVLAVLVIAGLGITAWSLSRRRTN